MKKAEFIQEVTNIAKENGAKVSQEAVKQVMDSMEVVIAKVVEARDVVNVCGMIVETKETAARMGKMNFGENIGTEYPIPAKISPKVRFAPAKKEKLTKEI